MNISIILATAWLTVSVISTITAIIAYVTVRKFNMLMYRYEYLHMEAVRELADLKYRDERFHRMHRRKKHG